jgi:thymidine phosphorylase
VSVGTLFLVVGPSGAGKDTLLEGAKRALAGDPSFVFATRVITRPADAGGEAHEEATPQEFLRRRDRGEFLLWWGAHNLHYGISSRYADPLAAGRHVVANVSRAVLSEAATRVAASCMIEVTAPPDILLARLTGRGRETEDEIRGRLGRRVPDPPQGLRRIVVVNDGPVETGVARLVAALKHPA